MLLRSLGLARWRQLPYLGVNGVLPIQELRRTIHDTKLFHETEVHCAVQCHNEWCHVGRLAGRVAQCNWLLGFGFDHLEKKRTLATFSGTAIGDVQRTDARACRAARQPPAPWAAARKHVKYKMANSWQFMAGFSISINSSPQHWLLCHMGLF